MLHSYQIIETKKQIKEKHVHMLYVIKTYFTRRGNQRLKSKWFLNSVAGMRQLIELLSIILYKPFI